MSDGAQQPPSLSPDEISSRTFPTAFRGFDPVEVRGFLAQVADEVRALTERLNEVAVPSTPPPELDAGQAEEEVAAAKERARAIEAESTERAMRLVAEAREEAERVRREAEQVAVTKTAEAEGDLDKLRSAAERDAAAIRVKAREEADAIIEQARERGREMVTEAQAARERMMADLNKRRRAGQAQLDQLKLQRDRLLDALRSARRLIDDITVRFEVADPAAAAAARAAAALPPSPPAASSASTASTAPKSSPAVAPVSSNPSPRQERPVAPRPSISAPRVSEEPPAPPPEQAVQEPASPPEERRTSALRILRRRSAAPPPPPRTRDEPGEGVRILRPSPVEEIDLTLAEPEPAPEPEVDLTEPERAPAPEPEAVDEPEPVAEPGPEPTPDAEPEPEVVAEQPEKPEQPEKREEQTPAHPRSQSKVDELFARIKADREETVERAREVLAEQAPAPVAATATIDRDAVLLRGREEVLAPLLAQASRKLKRSLQDEQNEALDRLRTARGARTAASVLDEPDVQLARYAQTVAAFLDQAAGAAAANSSFGAAPVNTVDLASQLAAEVAGTLRVRLDQVLEAAAAEDLELAGISERISSVYRDWKGQRVERAVDHFLLTAWSRGAFVATPEGTPQRWIVDDGGQPCPDCDDNALAGPTPRGETFPTGQLHPPAHVGCRCVLTTGAT